MSAKTLRPRSSQDFFLELIKGSQRRSGFLAERERWLRSLRVDGREEVLFELEMLLRGVERYFNLHNLPIDQSSRPVVARDFHDEMEDVRDAINDALRLARLLLDPASDQKMVFRRYIETQLADDRSRRELIEEQLDQNTPQESLFVLRLSLDALRTIIDHLLKLEVCTYSLFNEVGTLALREIVLNPYFRPFRPLEFRIEYDRIKSVMLLEALRRLPGPERKLFTVALLGLFRNLHYLSYVAPDRGESERRHRVILALVHSETVSLVGYLRTELATGVSDKRHRAGALKMARETAKETHRVARELLAEPSADTAAAASAFARLFKHQIEILARAIGPELTGADLFQKLTSSEERAKRLRRDLWAFVELCRNAEQVFRAKDAGDAVATLESLRTFIGYFHDVSYQLLRYGDYEAFDRFTAMVLELEQPPQGPVARSRFAEDCRLFAQLAYTTFASVNRRADLATSSFDETEARALVHKFWKQAS